MNMNEYQSILDAALNKFEVKLISNIAKSYQITSSVFSAHL